MTTGDIGSNPARAYWGVIQSAVYQGATTQDVWAALHDAASNLGMPSVGADAIQVGQLVSLAAKMRNAMGKLTNAAPGTPITTDMIGTDITAATRGLTNLAQQYQTRYLIEFQTSTGVVQEWRSSQIFDTLPDSVDDLIDDGIEIGDTSPPSGDAVATSVIGMSLNVV